MIPEQQQTALTVIAGQVNTLRTETTSVGELLGHAGAVVEELLVLLNRLERKV